MEKKTIGAFIAVLRKASGMTQKQLAEKLNVSDKAISRWEREETLPDLTLIPVMAEIFGVTSDELLRGQRSNAEAPTPQAEEKSKKQLQYLLDKTRTDYSIHTLISLLVAVVGVIAAAILNLAFLRAIAGFWVGCVFFAVAAVLQLVFKIKCDARLQAEEFEGEALAHCQQALQTYTYWSLAAIAAMFAFTLPLAQIHDAYWGLSLKSWLGLDGGLFQPCLLVLAAAALLRLYLKGVFRGPKVRLILKTVAILLVILAVTTLGISQLQLILKTHRHWTGQGTAHADAQSFIEYMQQSLDAEGQYRKYEVIEQDSQGNPLVVHIYDPVDQTIWYIRDEWQGATVQYVWLNETVRYRDFHHSEAIYTYTDAQLETADRIIACIVHPFLLLYVIEIAAALLIYKKKAKKLP